MVVLTNTFLLSRWCGNIHAHQRPHQRCIFYFWDNRPQHRDPSGERTKKDYCCNAADPFKCDQKEDLDGFIIQLGLQLLRISHFADRLHEVFLGDVFTVRADGKQACTEDKSRRHQSRGATGPEAPPGQRGHRARGVTGPDQIGAEVLPASVHTFLRSAPLKPSDSFTMASKSKERGAVSKSSSVTCGIITTPVHVSHGNTLKSDRFVDKTKTVWLAERQVD